jgi:hypothetical protein
MSIFDKSLIPADKLREKRLKKEYKNKKNPKKFIKTPQ